MCDVFKTALKSEGYQNRTTSFSVISGNWLEDYFFVPLPYFVNALYLPLLPICQVLRNEANRFPIAHCSGICERFVGRF